MGKSKRSVGGLTADDIRYGIASEIKTSVLRLACKLTMLVVYELSFIASIQLKGLILAQNERWRRGLGMQVEREVYFGKWTAAKGTVMCRYLPPDLG